jgi:hypothetical protein
MSRFAIVGLLLALVAGPLTAEDVKKDAKAHQFPAPPKHEGLDKLKKLTGEWVGTGLDGKTQVVTSYKVTAGGSAVVETIFPGTPMEMVTVYHLDGPDLVLTHYCMMGNQPHLKLDPKSPSNQLKFVFVGGTNLNPAKDPHMHEGSITIVDDDNIISAWVGYKDGKVCEEGCGPMKLTRKK